VSLPVDEMFEQPKSEMCCVQVQGVRSTTRDRKSAEDSYTHVKLNYVLHEEKRGQITFAPTRTKCQFANGKWAQDPN
jgi:hypothetical protein